MDFFANTDIGKIRTKNQDQAAVVTNGQDQILALVCDGMGGHKAGEIASHVVKEHVLSCFRCNPPFIDSDEVVEWMKDTVNESHQIVRRMADMDEDTKGMGTTIAMIVIDQNKAYLCHVGDSRIYFVNDEKIKQMTKDHTFVNELVDRGAITLEAAKTHAQKNVLTQAIGADVDVVPTIHVEEMEDYNVVLCSDGLYNSIDDDVIYKVMNQNIPVQVKVNEMIDKANQNGGRDNIAVVIVEHKGGHRYE